MASKHSVTKASRELTKAQRAYLDEVLNPTAITGYKVRELRDAMSDALRKLLAECSLYIRENG